MLSLNSVVEDSANLDRLGLEGQWDFPKKPPGKAAT